MTRSGKGERPLFCGDLFAGNDPVVSGTETGNEPKNPAPDLNPLVPEPENFGDLFERLAHSDFRSRFHLKKADWVYVEDKGWTTIRAHAADLIHKRLAPAQIPNDGKQTPMRGHPVFIAQHATGCCCRGCLSKWHHLPAGRELTAEEQHYVVAVLMEWMRREKERCR